MGLLIRAGTGADADDAAGLGHGTQVDVVLGGAGSEAACALIRAEVRPQRRDRQVKLPAMLGFFLNSHASGRSHFLLCEIQYLNANE